MRLGLEVSSNLFCRMGRQPAPRDMAGSGWRALVFFLREDAMHSFLRMRSALWTGFWHWP